MHVSLRPIQEILKANFLNFTSLFKPRNIYRFGTEVFNPLRTKGICFI